MKTRILFFELVPVVLVEDDAGRSVLVQRVPQMTAQVCEAQVDGVSTLLAKLGTDACAAVLGAAKTAAQQPAAGPEATP